MIIHLNLDEKGECGQKRKRAKFGSTWVQIVLLYLKTNLLVWSRLLNVVTGGGCFLGKKSDLKMKS